MRTARARGRRSRHRPSHVTSHRLLRLLRLPPTPPPPPPPPPGNRQDISPSAFQALETTGGTLANYHVTGGVSLNKAGLTLDNVYVDGEIDINADNITFKNGYAEHVSYLSGADGLLLENNLFDGHSRTKDGVTMWDKNGDPPSGWVFRGNTFQNFLGSSSSDHSQALYVGYSTNGLIENNTFINNGTTSHIFFTWWGDIADSRTSYPRNICVRGNRFLDNQHHYYAINFRSEIPTSSGIKTDPNEQGFSTTSSQFNGAC